MPSSDRRRRQAGTGRVALAVLALPAALAIGGCALWLDHERGEMMQARAAYQDCVDAHPADAKERCAPLEADARVTAERYDSDARQAWGCAASTDGCPEERPSGAGR